MISLLLPTRQRPKELRRLVDSINQTATKPDRVELVTYIDDDDHTYEGLRLDTDWVQVRGPRRHKNGIVNLSEKWNRCYDRSVGEIVMHAGDDIVFRTPGWDDIVLAEFDKYPDRILFCYGRDGYNTSVGTHGFLHRNWVKTVGYLFPPLFSSDYNDVFLTDVARRIGRCREVDIETEHLHYMAGKAKIDQNTRERLERHQRDRPDRIYKSGHVQQMIRKAAADLQAAMR